MGHTRMKSRPALQAEYFVSHTPGVLASTQSLNPKEAEVMRPRLILLLAVFLFGVTAGLLHLMGMYLRAQVQ